MWKIAVRALGKGGVPFRRVCACRAQEELSSRPSLRRRALICLPAACASLGHDCCETVKVLLCASKEGLPVLVSGRRGLPVHPGPRPTRNPVPGHQRRQPAGPELHPLPGSLRTPVHGREPGREGRPGLQAPEAASGVECVGDRRSSHTVRSSDDPQPLSLGFFVFGWGCFLREMILPSPWWLRRSRVASVASLLRPPAKLSGLFLLKRPTEGSLAAAALQVAGVVSVAWTSRLVSRVWRGGPSFMRRAAEECLTLLSKDQRQDFHYCILKASRDSMRLEEGKRREKSGGRTGEQAEAWAPHAFVTRMPSTLVYFICSGSTF